MLSTLAKATHSKLAAVRRDREMESVGTVKIHEKRNPAAPSLKLEAYL